MIHCVKSVQIRSYFWSVFSCFWTEYGVNLRVQSEYRKIRTRNNSVFGHISGSNFFFLFYFLFIFSCYFSFIFSLFYFAYLVFVFILFSSCFHLVHFHFLIFPIVFLFNFLFHFISIFKMKSNENNVAEN